jgi:MinD superfamily P-loop ATPase
MPEMPIVNPELCNGCGLCVTTCRCGVLVLVNNVITLVEREECSYCTQGYCTDCEAVCPMGAIRCPYEIVIEEHYEKS